jgi:hypothetical protein
MNVDLDARVSFCASSRLAAASQLLHGTLLSFEGPHACRAVAGAGARAHLENSIAALHGVLSDQENKSTRWMPRRQEAMKDAGGCDKPGEGADQPLIPGCPNGETHAW